MIVTESRAEARRLLDAHRAEGRSVGVVGTSGGAHSGHLSLIETARAECDVAAVFWTGAFDAFGDGIAQHYARDSGRDARLFERHGAGLMLVTRGDDFYRRPPAARVRLPELEARIQDFPEARHMDIIVTMVAAMLNVAGPCTMVFGEKDWPQLVMFQRMAEDLVFGSRVIGSPTVREPDGLAVSSRNSRLTPAERAAAPELYRALCAARDAVDNGERDAAAVAKAVRERLEAVGEPDYVVVAEAGTLRPVTELAGPVRLLASVTFPGSGTPLVDNIGATAGEERA